MIIHPPIRLRGENDLTISARIEPESGQKGADLWFRFRDGEDGKSPDPSADLDPFVTALLLVAMQRGESIRSVGPLSRKLWTGLMQYQRVYHSWFPDRFKIVAIEPSGLRDDAPAGDSAGRACAFSGGVDSFYTFLRLLGRGGASERPPLTHALFMAGFDMPLNLTWSIGELSRSYSQMMRQLGIGFISGSTNVRSFVNTVDWTNAHGQALAASALFFKKDWRNFFVPSSYTQGSSPKWGTHPRLDPLLSTESMDFIHHGSEADRVRKLELVSQASESFERLRVCWIQDLGLKNCGECEKCIRTMIALDVLDKLDNYRTFEPGALTRAKIRRLPQRTHQGRIFSQELIYEAVRRGKFGTCLNLGYSLIKRAILRAVR